MGCIYKRGNVYWIKYYRYGKPYQESSRSKKEADAKRLLKKREGEVSDGKLPGIYFDRVRFDELSDDFITDYKINQKKSLVRAERSAGHLKGFFQGIRVTNITTPLIQSYIESRIDKNASNATINRELSALKRMLNLGARQTPPKVDRVPYIPMLKEHNVRKGFFEHGEFIAVRNELPEHLKGFVTFAYKTGWRLAEIADLKWNQVDLKNRLVRLEPGETKNADARTVYIDNETADILNAQLKKRKNLLPYVFLNHKSDDKIKRFDKAWKTACKNAKIGAKRFHDLRRTAVRNLVRSGVPERVAMMISGHKTRSVFDRYNIVSDADLKIAAQKQEAYLESQMVTVSVTVEDFPKKKRLADVS
ncbi:tyrosine-type recombinase/integrase [Thermodesulfobacteriota bacterium]